MADDQNVLTLYAVDLIMVVEYIRLAHCVSCRRRPECGQAECVKVEYSRLGHCGSCRRRPECGQAECVNVVCSELG